MSKIGSLGIAWRLSILTTLLVFLGFSTLGTTIYLYNFQQNQKRMVREAHFSLEIAAKTLIQPVWAFDDRALQEIAATLLQQEDRVVIAIQVLATNGNLLAERVHPSIKSDFSSLLNHPSHRIYEKELMKDNQTIGKVQVVFSSEVLEKNLFNLMIKLILITVATAILCSAFVFWLTHLILAEPLSGLVKIAEKIEHGNYSIQEEKWKHEFLILSRAFSEAAKAIQKRDQELKIYAENLEHQVTLRTSELDNQRMKMVNSSRLASLGEISAGIAHEINNPLAIIQGKTELLQKMVENNTLALSHLDKILSMVVRISQIVRGLRNFARDGSKDPMYSFHLDPFVEELKSLCQARIKNHQIDFSVTYPSDTQGFGREVQISQVIINLINNSIDAIESRNEKWIRLEIFVKNSALIFAVTDSGLGVPAQIREKIMEPFFTTKPIGRGTGLGLSISIGIAREHGGDLVYVDSAPNTRFEVHLPIAQGKQQVA